MLNIKWYHHIIIVLPRTTFLAVNDPFFGKTRISNKIEEDSIN